MNTLAVIETSSFMGTCVTARHTYAELIILNDEDITVDNVEEWGLHGEREKLTREFTYEEARQMDDEDGENAIFFSGCNNARMRWSNGDRQTERFNNYEEIKESGLERYKELKLKCPLVFLSLNDTKTILTPTTHEHTKNNI